MSTCACMGGPNCCRNRKPAYSEPYLPIPFDVERMKRALAGPRFMVPHGLTVEEIVAYFNEVAANADTGGVSEVLP